MCASSETEQREWMERFKELIDLFENADETGQVFTE